MFQKLIYLTILSAFLNIKAQTNFKHKFTYKLTYQPNNKDVYSKRSEDMLLLRNNNISVFLSKNTFICDSLSIEIKENNASIDWKEFPKTRFPYKILKDSSNDSLTVYHRLFMDNFKYKESKKNIKWKITSEVSTINGFKCQKATTKFSGRYYEAWFSEEIPISDGPYKFGGLPGLIIKISDLKKHYVFELISQSSINQSYPNLKPTKNIYVTDKSTFLKKHKEYKKNIVTKLSQSGFMIDDEHKKQIKEKYKKRNNPIELGDEWYLDH